MKNTDLELLEAIGDSHYSDNVDTPLRQDAFVKSDEEKIEAIQKHFKKIMEEI